MRAQVDTEAKSNEITAIPTLLKMLKLRGTIVTAHTLNCQRTIARQIVDQSGDYCLALKGNHGRLRDDVRRYFDGPEGEKVTMRPVVERDHGRIETRTAAVVTAIAWSGDHGWPGLRGIGKVVRRREIGDQISTETAYYLLGSPLSPERLNEVARLHWSVENRLH